MDEFALLQAARKLDKEGLTIIFDTYRLPFTGTHFVYVMIRLI